MREIAVLGSSEEEKKIFKKYASAYQVTLRFYENIEQKCRAV